jgi:putative heme transporter
VRAAPPSTGSAGAPAVVGRSSRRRVWLVVRIVVYAALAYLAVELVIANSAELSGAASYLDHVHWDWIAAAAAAEIASYLAFTQLQRRLLLAGGVHTRMVPMTAITLAGNAMNTSLPGGGAFATVFAYRQFRRRGADEALTTWTIVAFTLLTALTLSLMSVAGLWVAGEDGPVAGLWPVIPLLLAVPVVLVVLLLRPRWIAAVIVPPLRWLHRVTSLPRVDPVPVVRRLVHRLEAVTPRFADWVAGLGWALANWLTDCLCLILAFEAVGATVPWRGLLVAYGAAQVATNLPITPGGLGVVEGSLTIALVAYGGSTAGSVAAVLLYRIMSFWVPMPLGWLAWVGLRVEARRNPLPEAGIVAETQGGEAVA